MALDLNQTTLQLLSAMDGVTRGAVSHAQSLSDTLERGLGVPADAAASRTAAVGRRPYIAARTGPEGLLGSIPPPEAPSDWSALSVDGSHIDVDRHLPLRCHLINLGGCALSYGRNFGCRMFSEPSLAVDDQDLYLRRPDDTSDEVLIAGPLLGALRTVREVERLADAVADLPTDRPGPGPPGRHPGLLGPAKGQLPPLRRRHPHRQTAAHCPGPPAGGLHRSPARRRRRLHLPAPHHRGSGRRTPHALRPGDDAECNRCCNARHSDRPRCDAAAGFDDRELFEVLLEPGHRSPLYQPSRLAARFALGLTVGEDLNSFFYLHGGAEIARVEVPDWLADDPELLALAHAMLVKQCQLGLGYPVAISEAHEQAVISGHDRAEFRRVALMLLEQRGLPTTESAKSFSKRRPWV